MNLDGKNVVVTGGTRGLGLGLVFIRDYRYVRYVVADADIGMNGVASRV